MQMKGFFLQCVCLQIFRKLIWMMQIFTFINLFYLYHLREKK